MLASIWWRHLAVNTLCALFVAALVWAPEPLHYHIAAPEYAPSSGETMLQTPGNERLFRLSGIDLMEVVSRNASDKAIAAALPDNTLLPGVASRAVMSLSDWSTDLSRSGEMDGLILSSLELEDRAMKEYEATGSIHALHWAFQRIESFMRYEASLRRPVSYIWNDHATAARVSVLIRYWRHLRMQSSANDPRLRALVASIERHGYLLAKASHFTVQTNHGVMQNIALVQIAEAFPYLPRANDWRDLGFRRFEQQMRFYLTDQGVILEHSPGYQHFGVLLLQHMELLYTLSGRNMPAALEAAIKNTRHHLRWLQRSDCSLPRVGNTTGGAYPMLSLDAPDCSPPVGADERATGAFGARVLPDEGYAIWRGDAGVSWHLLMAWSYHLDHPHKHADEPSVVYWIDGTELLTASGYWPYDHSLYDAANGWRGSNAPHYVNEPFGSKRTSALVAHGAVDGLGVAEVKTSRADGSSLARQVVRLPDGDLLVVDAMDNATGDVETLWTFEHSLSVQSRDSGTYQVVRSNGQLAMTVHPEVLMGQAASYSLLSGSERPFGGWTVVDGSPRASTSLVRVMTGPDHVSATFFSLNGIGRIDMSRSSYQSTSRWLIVLDGSVGERTIERNGSELLLSHKGVAARLLLGSHSDSPQASAERRSAIIESMQMYPRWRDLSQYRVKVLWVVAALWMLAVVVVLAASRIDRRDFMARYLLPTSVLSWASVAVWIEFFYFA